MSDCKNYGEYCLLKGEFIVPEIDCKSCQHCNKDDLELAQRPRRGI